MNDQELADAVVRILGGVRHPTAAWTYRFTLDMPPLTATDFVRDWRVAGALMEKVVGKPNYWQITLDRKCSSVPVARVYVYDIEGLLVVHTREDSLERALIRACVEALSTVADKQEES